MKLHTVIGDKESCTKVFSINLLDVNNEKHTIQAFGVPKTGTIQAVLPDGIKGLFSDKIQQEWDKVGARPSGEVELLIGSNYIGLHPYRIEAHNNIKVLKVHFRVRIHIHTCWKSQCFEVTTPVAESKYLTRESKHSRYQLKFQICQRLLGLE